MNGIDPQVCAVQAPIHIMHIVDSLGTGGLENGLVNLVDRLNPKSFQHTVCAIRRLGPNAQRLICRGATVFRLNQKESDSRIQIASLARTIRALNPDVVHSRNWGAIEAVLAARWVRSCGVVHSEHGLDAEMARAEPRRRRWFRRLAFGLAHEVLSVSCGLRDLHAQRTGFPAGKIKVIHNGVDIEKFSQNGEVRKRVRQELQLLDEDFCIACVGSLTAVKDYPTVIRAVGEIAKLHSNWRLLIWGDGPERDSLKRLVKNDQRLDGRVSFLGLSERIAELLNAVDVYVLSSLIEGISNSLLEAMATGLPVVATETGGNPEVVIKGDSGMLFAVGDHAKLSEHLLLLLSRKDLRQDLGRNAACRVRNHFSVASMIQEYDLLYRRLAASTLRHGAKASARDREQPFGQRQT